MSDRVYNPDCWVVIEITEHASAKPSSVFKILGGWYGGFAGSNYWRLSSGVVNLQEKDGVITVPQSSGSTYVVNRVDERMSGIMAATFAGFEEDVAKDGKYTIKVIGVDELIEKLAVQTSDFVGTKIN